MACPYCYARRMYDRFKWNPEIRYDDWVWQVGSPIPKGSKVFVGSTMELFHDKTIQYLPIILEYCESVKSRTFIFLTKCPQNLPREFPDNCWVGVSIPNEFVLARDNSLNYLSDVKAKVKFISFEPLQSKMAEPYLLHIGFSIARINWVIIGQQTPPSPKTAPKIEWVKEIVRAADNADVPVFLKSNLNSCAISDYPELLDSKTGNLRQEFPKVGVLSK